MLRPNKQTTQLKKERGRRDMLSQRLENGRKLHEFYNGKSENAITGTDAYKLHQRVIDKARKGRIRR